MLKLREDLDRYKNIPPYASEHYGVYQPLLGWNSQLTKDWMRPGEGVIDPRVQRILNGRIEPHPVQDNEFLAHPLEPGSGKSPWRVILVNDMGSEVLKIVRDAVQRFVDGNQGRLPAGDEWRALLDINAFMDDQNGPLRAVNDRHRDRILARLTLERGEPPRGELYKLGAAEHLAVMQYESQVAAMLFFYAESQEQYRPDTLAKLFTVSIAPDLDALFASPDPLVSIDPRDRGGVLSPIGFVHLFRQYFFDLGTFVGEPVEHVWLAPGTTIEMIEVNTRRTLVERTEESLLETTDRAERSSAVKDELSDAIRSENASSTKLGVTTTQSVDFSVYQGSATASVGVEDARKDARENVHKQSREQSEKLSTEIKRSFKSVFRTVTETTDTRTKRYVLSNPGLELVNYELRRKMRRVGVQVQDLGTQLCWQVFVDDPGATLGLAELMHYADSPDLANIKVPDELPVPGPMIVKLAVPIGFVSAGHSDNGGALYTLTGKNADNTTFYGNRTNTNEDAEKDKRILMGPFNFRPQPPRADYALTNARAVGAPPSQTAIVQDGYPLLHTDGANKPDGTVDFVMKQLMFNYQETIQLEVEFEFSPTSAAMDTYKEDKKTAEDKYKAEVARTVKKSYTESVRDRIKAARNIAARPSWDLRDEERTVVYRRLLRRLMLDSWGASGDADQRRLNHVRSEIIRTIFDVDAMLYFVAPEWWMPRRHRTSHTFTADVDFDNQTVNLTDENKIRWKDTPSRGDNYSITEDSQPAPLGSSLGWLLQLDGDNLRNAFLNAPWVKAVIPVRPGRERAALNWLRAIEGHEDDGWESIFVASTEEDARLVAEVEADGHPPQLGFILEKIADKLSARNSDINQTLANDEVFETGFDPLGKAFDAEIPTNQVFSQWISVLPTDQIVASKYEPREAWEL